MIPVVDGLEEVYQDRVVFRRIDANSPTGKSAYQAYALRGHPGFVLMSPDGAALWKGIGEQPVENLEEPILLVVDELGEQLTFDFNKFIEELELIDVSIGMGDSISQPFFTPQGQIVRLNGEDLQVYEYRNEEEATDEAKLVSADGNSVGTSMITWIDTPHFYQSGRIIVIYVGNNPQVIETLTELLGLQFSGK
jgi:hypothetical protein